MSHSLTFGLDFISLIHDSLDKRERKEKKKTEGGLSGFRESQVVPFLMLIGGLKFPTGGRSWHFSSPIKLCWRIPQMQQVVVVKYLQVAWNIKNWGLDFRFLSRFLDRRERATFPHTILHS